MSQQSHSCRVIMHTTTHYTNWTVVCMRQWPNPRPNLLAAVSPSLVPPRPWFFQEMKLVFSGSVSVCSSVGECDCVPRHLNCCILRKCRFDCRRTVSTNILLLASLIASRVRIFVHCIHLKGSMIIATRSERSVLYTAFEKCTREAFSHFLAQLTICLLSFPFEFVGPLLVPH